MEKELKTYMKVIKAVALMYAPYKSLLYDDLIQEGSIGLWRALENFDPKKGVRSQHVKRGIRNHIYDFLRKIKRWNKETSFSDMDSFLGLNESDEPNPDDETVSKTFNSLISANHDGLGEAPEWVEPSNNPEEEYLRKEEVELARKKVSKIQSQLNERELYVLWNYILADEKKPYRQIAEQFHCSKDAIYRDVIRLGKLLREIE
jgi:RNA polymerase sigma factor (sigma-70 family)